MTIALSGVFYNKSPEENYPPVICFLTQINDSFRDYRFVPIYNRRLHYKSQPKPTEHAAAPYALRFHNKHMFFEEYLSLFRFPTVCSHYPHAAHGFFYTSKLSPKSVYPEQIVLLTF